ncbi:RES family NAD+ phosphorylase [Cupriavidus sp. D384]|uniref:RES family NAD+ phosphorylase n=1 Tax=Cupriavidus sp. D384 TaxID=1538095 RepID=UPI0009EDB9DF|nr:RES family NAD+ phosphorylase [Cupriavidus sp. D384]
MRCCANCFGDLGLTRIFPSKADVNGKCSYCDTDDTPLAIPASLVDIFSAVINIYDEDPAGKGLVEWMRGDWAIFRHPRMDDFRAKDLLAAITGIADIGRRTFVPSDRFRSDRLVRWEKLRDELRNTNRYFPEAQLDKGRLEELLEFLQAENMPLKWYRARIQPSESMFAIGEMGAPPSRVASHGRANPPGIPYLYVGSSPATAIAEIRPHTGEYVSVADFSIDPARLRLVDLRAPKERISPFEIGDEDRIGALRSDIAFLERLGDELTRPVVPQGAAVEYVPSQYLCEFIKKAGWNGVVYRSSMSDGINLALFNPAIAAPGGVTPWVVSRVSVEAGRL